MRKFPVVSGKNVVTALKTAGFQEVSQKGSHIKLKGLWDGDNKTVIVPIHEELALGTLKSILRQAGMTIDEIKNFL